jgi:hypothetical protein
MVSLLHYFSALLHPFEDGKARTGSQAMPKVESYDQQLATLLPVFRERMQRSN